MESDPIDFVDTQVENKLSYTLYFYTIVSFCCIHFLRLTIRL